MQMMDKFEIYHTEHSVNDIYEWKTQLGSSPLAYVCVCMLLMTRVCLIGKRGCVCVDVAAGIQ